MWLILGSTTVCLGCDTLGISGGETYKGNFSGPMNYTVACNVTCTSVSTVSGRVEIELEQSGSKLAGEGTVFANVVGGVASPSGCGTGPSRNWDGGGNFNGTAASFGFSHEYTASGAMTVTTRTTFAGVLIGDVINGVVTITHTGEGNINPGCRSTEGSSASFNVTLQR